MFYLDRINQINLLITACFSFFIFALSLFYKNNKSDVRAGAACFLAPLTLSVISFLSANITVSETTLELSGIILMVLLLLVYGSRTSEKNFYLIQTIVFSAVVIVSVFISISPQSFNSFVHGKAFTVISVLLPLFIMYLFRKENSRRKLIFWAALFDLGGACLISLSSSETVLYICLLIKFIECTLFSRFYYRGIHDTLLSKALESKKKDKTIDKTINLEVKKRVFEIERSNERLATIAKEDPMTKAYNKGAILDSIQKLTSKPNAPFSILMFDIDNFKLINDTLGHIQGDKCIKKLVLIAKGCLREIDTLGRYGGDEFVILLPGSTPYHAGIVAERFRRKVNETENPHFTVSIGIANFPEDGTTVDELIACADQGLYLSKSKGRNAVSHKDV